MFHKDDAGINLITFYIKLHAALSEKYIVYVRTSYVK